jgi:hypothetical protein
MTIFLFLVLFPFVLSGAVQLMLLERPFVGGLLPRHRWSHRKVVVALRFSRAAVPKPAGKWDSGV